MGRQLVSDDLWAAIEPHLPKKEPSPYGGRPPVPDRVALTGIVFVLRTGIAWEDFPQELGCSGMTLWRRLRDWQAAGVWDRIHRAFLDRLGAADQIDWERAALDTAAVPAKRGARSSGAAASTAARPARAITSSPMAAGRRSRSASRRAIATTRSPSR